MESIVKFDFKPVLKDPVLIESLPGIGNVGKIAGDHLAELLEAKKFATIYSMEFPPQVIPDDDNVIKMACNELKYAKSPNGQDIIFLCGNYQGSTSEGQFVLAQDMMELLIPYGLSRIITLGGYGIGQIVKERHIYGAVSRVELKKELEELGVTFNPGEPKAGIVGAAGLLLGFGQMNGIDSFCLMGETSGFFIDHGSAIGILKVLGKMFGIEDLKLDKLEEESKKLDEFTEKASAQHMPQNKDLGYIG